jgi:hypothetical protein
MNKIFQAKFVGIIALDEPLNEEARYSICLEDCQVRRLDIKKLAEEEVERHTYSLENLGRCNILTEKEGKPHLIKAKSKKATQSQVFRLIVEKIDDYDAVMKKLINHAEGVIDYLSQFDI